MDQNETSTTEFTNDESFGKTVAKSITLSAASTAGAWVGLIAVGLAYSKFKDFQENRAAKKETTSKD